MKSGYNTIIGRFSALLRQKRSRLALAALLMAGIGMQDSGLLHAQNQNSLLIYCGITMKAPMQEIATLFENQENCKVEFSIGGSGNLAKSIRMNKVGDLFIPGADSYINNLEQEGIVTAKTLMGINQAVLVVQKGNPMGINGVEALTNPKYKVAIARANSGSIGKEAKSILDAYGIYQKVLANALFLTTDSKDLVSSIRSKKIDVTINWRAAALTGGNAAYMDIIQIPKAAPERLVLGTLSYSSNPALARKFFNFANSEQGKAIFRKWGF